MYYVDKTVESNAYPELLEVTPTAVYVREGVKEINDEERTFYRYRESKYNKDEYVEKLSKSNDSLERMSLTTMMALVEKNAEIERVKKENETLKLTNITALKGIAELNADVEKLKGGATDQG